MLNNLVGLFENSEKCIKFDVLIMYKPIWYSLMVMVVMFVLSW